MNCKVELAGTFFARVKGLLGRKTMAPDEALVIYPCMSVHTWFMRFPIDVVFLDKKGRILRVVRNMAPYRLSPLVRGAYYCVEMMGGVLPESVKEGQKVVMEGGRLKFLT